MGIQHACFSQSDDPARYNVRHPRFYNWLLLIEIPCSVGSVLQFLWLLVNRPEELFFQESLLCYKICLGLSQPLLNRPLRIMCASSRHNAVTELLEWLHHCVSLNSFPLSVIFGRWARQQVLYLLSGIVLRRLLDPVLKRLNRQRLCLGESVCLRGQCWVSRVCDAGLSNAWNFVLSDLVLHVLRRSHIVWCRLLWRVVVFNVLHLKLL